MRKKPNESGCLCPAQPLTLGQRDDTITTSIETTPTAKPKEHPMRFPLTPKQILAAEKAKWTRIWSK